ncbi:MAG: DNA repair protein RadA [Thermodesulfovibrionales bacterium]
MAKTRTVYQCQACGYTSPRWLGKCPDCGQWNSMAEEKPVEKPRRLSGSTEPVPLEAVSGETGKRTSTGIAELDRVLGGGVVPGSVVLIGGDPGIGKSTLLLQAVSRLGPRVLYVSGEESPEQIKMRAERLSVRMAPVMLLAETALGNVLAAASDMKPDALVVDSIQTVYTEELDSAPGSVGQVRECASSLMFFAKRSGVPVFLIGHVTKEGAIAGPRVLEHIVDTVLYFEGDRGHTYRILRAVKNRFGSANEIGVFEMTDSGLSEIENPSELFLSERPSGVSGSVVVSSMEGTRPLLVEIQALASQTTFGVPRRTSIGVDFQRVNLLIAVLEKIAGMHLGGMDVFTNVVGGLRLSEPAADLAVVLAIASSLREVPVGPDVIAFGEVGLSGEIRAVNRAETRLREAAKIGFRRAIIARGNAERLKENMGLEITGVRNIGEALEAAGI